MKGIFFMSVYSALWVTALSIAPGRAEAQDTLGPVPEPPTTYAPVEHLTWGEEHPRHDLGADDARAERREQIRAERQLARDRFRLTISLGGGLTFLQFLHPDYGYEDIASGWGLVPGIGFRRHFHRFLSFQMRAALFGGSYDYGGQYPEPLYGAQLGVVVDATLRLTLAHFYFGVGPVGGFGTLVDLATSPVFGGVAEIGSLAGRLEQVDFGARLILTRNFVALTPVVAWSF